MWDNTTSGKDGRLQLLQYLPCHRSTVTSTCTAWLGATRVLLSVGKDRQLAFWKLGTDRKYESLVVYPKAHGRVIWDCCAVLEHSRVVNGQEMAVFATASRDCTVRVFGVTGEGHVTV